MFKINLKGMSFPVLALFVTAFLSSSTLRADDLLVKSGEKIAFMGDSITQQGAGPGGYCRLVLAGLEANGVKAEPIFAGISGHKSDQMLARLDKDVIDNKPNWMTLSCGVNDVWHGKTGVPLEEYKKNITAIADKCDAAKIKVVILTSTMIKEDQPNENNQKLVAYNDFLRELAKERKYPLADLNADMQEEIKSAPAHTGNYLTVDGVHMNPLGNEMMAAGVLKAFGVNDAGMKKARESWLDMPGPEVKVSLTVREYQKLSKLAASRKQSVQDLVGAELKKSVDELLKSEKSDGGADKK